MKVVLHHESVGLIEADVSTEGKPSPGLVY